MTTVAEAADDLRAWANPDDGVARVPLGYEVFDKQANGGIALGEMCMFVARSGVGKTAFALNTVVNNRGVPTVVFSLEMHARFIVHRLAGIWNRTPTKAIESQLRADVDCPALDATAVGFDWVEIEDEPGMSIRTMGEKLDDIEQSWGQPPRFVIIDYLELVRSPSMSAGEGVDKVSRALKNFARDFNVALLVLHQVNREAGDGWQALQRKAIRYDADVAADYTLAAYRPGLDPSLALASEQVRMQEMEKFNLQVLKTRTSSQLNLRGTQLHFDTESLRISEPIVNRIHEQGVLT